LEVKRISPVSENHLELPTYTVDVANRLSSSPHLVLSEKQGLEENES